MKKEAFILFLVFIFLTQASAQSIDTPIKKITYQAEQYETGNINYAQLIVYISSLKQDIAEAMGSIGEEHDPVLKAEQLESALGKPTETTKWAWAETGDGNGHDKKLDEEVPAWRKIIFDGGKIQLWLNAWPNIITKNNEDVLFYRLHLDVRFKRPEKQINIRGKIEEISSLAEEYSLNPNEGNLENLAKESVAVEQSFNNYFNQNPGKCGELMNELFGSENKRDNQKLLVQEINLFEGDNFEAIIRFEMCDDCEWHWISLSDMRFESRGRFEHPEATGDYDRNTKGKFTSYSSENFKEETRKLVERMKSQIESGNYESAMEESQELRVLTDAWNEKANDIWKEVESKFRIDFESMTEDERKECQEDYCWIKVEQERRNAEKELRNKNYEERTEFYLELFSEYEKKEFYYEQEEWEKRLVEEFKEFGEEMCSNNVDDNNDEQIDCSDSQCGGKLCGYGTVIITDGAETREEKIELYCIAGACQAKEEIIKQEAAVCGNHVCEENEQESCIEDCTSCLQYETLKCAGDVTFSGKDEKGCPLEPICLLEKISCEGNDDCTDHLCGDASCVEGTCQIIEITECKEAECVDGEEKIQHCGSGEKIIAEKCVESLWRETGVECEIILPAEEETIEEEVAGDKCVVKTDCGNENDVCSNGKCVTLPQTIGFEQEELENEIEEEEVMESPREETQTEQEETEASQEIPETEREEPITGKAIFFFFRSLASKMGITGLVEEETIEEENFLGEENNPQEEGEQQAQVDYPLREEERDDKEEREKDERREREREEKERRENECRERCDRECYDREIRPCTEDCIWEECGNELECNIDETKVSCENKCETERNLDSCENECSEKCLAGEETWVEPERKEHKQEKFVFTVGGSCRVAQGRTESFIWFGGWGDDFNDFHLIKNKYYARGGGDWCEEDLENLIKQRKELENSLDEEFARWFFEKYVVNSADEWEKHISGIFELYWRDVDIAKQTAERVQCLGGNSLPEYNLINFEYKTDYGSIKFWEEVKTAKIYGDGRESQIISPYMKIWLFPSRDFFKAEMKKSMEERRLPGPPEEENRNTLSEEEKRGLRQDDEFMERIKSFNEDYGENLVIQFKDFDTNEIVFNVYMRINEEELIYFEPMPPSEIPAENVKAELDVNKLLDIIEYEESGRVELESPPWDKKPREGNFVKRATDGARIYFMFRGLMNSLIVTPESAKADALSFVRNFFEVVMRGDKQEREGREGPGGCQNEKECREYCENPDNREECMRFREFRDSQEFPESFEDKEFLTGEAIRNR